MNYTRRRSFEASNIKVTSVPFPEEYPTTTAWSSNQSLSMVTKDSSCDTESTRNLSFTSNTTRSLCKTPSDEWKDTNINHSKSNEVLHREVTAVIGEGFVDETDSPPQRPLTSQCARSSNQKAEGKTHGTKKAARKALVDMLAQAMVKAVLDDSEEAMKSSTSSAGESSTDGDTFSEAPSSQQAESISSDLVDGTRKVSKTGRSSRSSSVSTSLRSQSSGGSGSSGALTVEEVQAYVMDIIPESLKSKLSPETWEGILEAAANSHKHPPSSPSTLNATAKEVGRQTPIVDQIPPPKDERDGALPKRPRRHSAEEQRQVSHSSLEDSCSVVSDLTSPTAVASVSHKNKPRKRDSLSVSLHGTSSAGTTGSTTGSTSTPSNSRGILRKSHSSALQHLRKDVVPRVPRQHARSTTSKDSAPSVDKAVSRPSRRVSRMSDDDAGDDDGPSRCNSDAPPRCPGRSWQDGRTAEMAPRLPPRRVSSSDGTSSAASIASGELSLRGKLYYRTQSCNDADTLERRMPVNRSVSFTNIQVRYYERVLEVNPCTSSGPSVGLGWEYREAAKTFTVDEVERRACHNPRGPMPLPRHVREDIIRELGYSQKEIARAIRLSIKAKHQRRQTYNNLSAQKVEEVIEKSRKKVKKILRLGGGKKKSKNEGTEVYSTKVESVPENHCSYSSKQRFQSKESKNIVSSDRPKQVLSVTDDRW